MVGEVISTRVKLSFSQAQNFIADIALERNYTYYFWCVCCGVFWHVPLYGAGLYEIFDSRAGAMLMWRCWRRMPTQCLPRRCASACSMQC